MRASARRHRYGVALLLAGAALLGVALYMQQPRAGKQGTRNIPQ
jgi:hypothetical protein